MGTPFENWIVCPKCEGTGGDNTVLDWDPDYAPPRCPRCEGVGEIDPEGATEDEKRQSKRVDADLERLYADG